MRYLRRATLAMLSVLASATVALPCLPPFEQCGINTCCIPGPPGPPAPPVPPERKRARCIKACKRGGAFAACVANSALVDPWEPQLSASDKTRLCKKHLKRDWCTKATHFLCPNWGALNIAIVERVKALGSLRPAPGNDLLAMVVRRPTAYGNVFPSFRLMLPDASVDPIVERVLGNVTSPELLVFPIPESASGQLIVHYRMDRGGSDNLHSRLADGHAELDLPPQQERSALFNIDAQISDVTRIANDGVRTSGHEFLYLRVKGKYTSLYSSQEYLTYSQCGSLPPPCGPNAAVAYLHFVPQLVTGGQTFEPYAECPPSYPHDDVYLCSAPPPAEWNKGVIDLRDILPTACAQVPEVEGPSNGSFTCGALFVDPPGGLAANVVLDAGGSLFSTHPLNRAFEQTITLPTEVPRSGLGGDWVFTFDDRLWRRNGATKVGTEECHVSLYDGISDSGQVIYAAGTCQVFDKEVGDLIGTEGFLGKATSDGSGMLQFSYVNLCGPETTLVAQVLPDIESMSGELRCAGTAEPETFTAHKE